MAMGLARSMAMGGATDWASHVQSYGPVNGSKTLMVKGEDVGSAIRQ